MGAQDETTQNQDSLRAPRGGGPARTSLIVYHGERAEVVPLEAGDSLVLGRSAPSELIVDDANLSRRHARFSRSDEGVVVEDLDSTNGTYFRGVRLDAPATLHPGDAVTLGSVTVSVNRTADRAGLVSGIESYPRLFERIGDEVIRARTFLRGVAVLMIRCLEPDDGHVSVWIPRVRERLRPVDRLALYGSSSALVVLPETDRTRATAVATQLVADDPTLVAGVAVDGASAEELIDAARSLARRANARQRVVVEQNDGPASTDAPLFVSASMVSLSELVDRVAQAKIPVMVMGETGSGKEVVARAIHTRGPRAEGPLKTVNCGAMPANLLEALLFGHEKGAFTGAERTTPGLFEQADGGTLFLDEVAELSAASQVALLRILESKRVTRLGGQTEIPLDVRVVVATHRDLEAMVEEGSFREDLLFRLNPMTIRIPPLRERREEIDPLIDRFLDQASRETGSRVREIDDEARQLLREHAWPGNVRELRNVLDRAVVVCTAPRIGVADLPDRVRSRPALSPEPEPEDEGDADFKDRVKTYETKLILDALERAEGNQTKAAQLLRMPVRTLVYKIKAYGIRDRLDEG
ncbi:MAG: sigma 54-interacting transcriptional regulator [Sandaracinaceae bacterium]|nr:sigma 54-interacting transcriptional regulator [Sandaracinaceae bacterium]